jgi:hypothetical protein
VTQKVSKEKFNTLNASFSGTDTVRMISGGPYVQNRSHKRRRKIPTGVAMLPYQQAITKRKNSRLLAKYNIRTIHVPQKKNIYMLRPSRTTWV